MRRILGYSILGSAGVGIITPAFLHPHLTQTELFLTFWPLYSIILLWGAIGTYLLLGNNQ